MASPKALAIRQKAAIERIAAPLRDLAQVYGLEPVSLPSGQWDANHTLVGQLEAIADFLAHVAQAATQSFQPLARCAHCGGQVDLLPTGRPPKYCGDACRQAAYRERTVAWRRQVGPVGRTTHRRSTAN